MQESSWARAGKDTEYFRQHSGWYFWMVEILGGGALFGLAGTLIGARYVPDNANVLQQNTYPGIGTALGVIVGFVAVYGAIFTWNLFRAPYQQRNEALAMIAKLEKSLGNIGYMEAFRWEAHENLQKLHLWQSNGHPINDHEVAIYREWFLAVSKWLQTNMNTQVVDWHHQVDIGPAQPTMDNIIRAYESGFSILGKLQKTIESTVDKASSPTSSPN